VKVTANGLQRSSQQITFRQHWLGFPADAAGTANYASRVQPVSLIVLCTSCDQCKHVRQAGPSWQRRQSGRWNRDVFEPRDVAAARSHFMEWRHQLHLKLCVVPASSWAQLTQLCEVVLRAGRVNHYSRSENVSDCICTWHLCRNCIREEIQSMLN